MIFRWLFIAALVVLALVSYGDWQTENSPTPPANTEEEIILTETPDTAEENAETENTEPAEEAVVEDPEITEPNTETEESPTPEATQTPENENLLNESGIASHYGSALDGHKVASGGTLDINEMQAAHKTLPFGTKVKVSLKSDPDTSVVVEIVDRGPYVAGRIIDLTPAAFEKLAPLGRGLVEVNIQELAE